MSTLKTRNVQIGTSETAEDNYRIYQPSVDDGTLRVAIGNATAPEGSSDILIINGTSRVFNFKGSVSATDITASSVTVTSLPTSSDHAVRSDRSIIAGNGLTGGGNLLTDVTISHEDTSSQASVDNSNGSVIQDVTLDTYGHVTGLNSYDLDNRYFTKTEVGNQLDEKLSLSGGIMTSDLSVTNVIVSEGIRLASGKGINFSAYGAGTGIDSNLLDDYEEGTWDPDYAFSTSGSVTLGSNTQGYYVKVGKIVHATFQINTTALSSPAPSGDATITGLPFNSTTATDYRASVAIGYAVLWGTSINRLKLHINPNSDHIEMQKGATDASPSAVTNSDFDSGSNNNILMGTVSYEVV